MKRLLSILGRRTAIFAAFALFAGHAPAAEIILGWDDTNAPGVRKGKKR